MGDAGIQMGSGKDLLNRAKGRVVPPWKPLSFFRYSSIIIVFMSLLLLCMTTIFIPDQASADYDFDGFPLMTIKKGCIRGGVFVDAGDKCGCGLTPYTTHYDVPDGEIVWARVYVGVWGGTEDYHGWVNASFNDLPLGNVTLRGKDDTNEHTYAASHGVHWVWFDNVRDKIGPGRENRATARTEGVFGGSGSFDGRVYGLFLMSVYENDALPFISYWFNEGHECLNYVNEHDNCTTSFEGSIDPVNATSASLYTIQLCGGADEADLLYLNGCQLGYDVADSSSGYGADVDKFNVTDCLGSSGNTVEFRRGSDSDGDEAIGPEEGEAYLHPVSAVLVVEHRNGTEPEMTGAELSVSMDITGEMTGEMTDGGTVVITAFVENTGGKDADNFTVSFHVGNTVIETRRITVGGGEKMELRAAWNATAGRHKLGVMADAAANIAEGDETNNVAAMEIYIRTKADLSVEIGTPVRKEADGSRGTDPFNGVLMGLIPVLFLPLMAIFSSERRKRNTAAIIMLMIIIAGGIGIYNYKNAWDGDNDGQQNPPCPMDWDIPVVVRNTGETACENCSVALYIDGMRERLMNVERIEGNSQLEKSFGIMLERTGEHLVKVIVDEVNGIAESNETNNISERRFAFIL